jgi:hypothetical protein
MCGAFRFITNVYRTMLTDIVVSRYQDGKYSDLAIVSGETTYRVHKLVVCSRSAFFAKACDGPFQVSS